MLTISRGDHTFTIVIINITITLQGEMFLQGSPASEDLFLPRSPAPPAANGDPDYERQLDFSNLFKWE